MAVAEFDPDVPAATVNTFHKKSDVDSGPNAQHHTIGPRKNQAADGAHTHDGLNSLKIVGQVPAGGSAGQVLAKNTATDYDTAWVAAGGGGGGVADPGSNGVMVRTALNTTIARQIAAGSSKVSVTNPTGVGGDPTVDVVPANFTGIPESGVTNLVTDLAGKLADSGANGVLVRTAAGTTVARTLGAGSSKVSITNPDGVAGAPSIDVVPANFTGIPESGITNLVTDLAAKVPTSRLINTTAPVAGGGDLSADRTLSIVANGITNALAAQMAANTIKGNNTGVLATPLDLTAAQVTAILNAFTSVLQGLVPASGGGTTNFLRADATWAVPIGLASDYQVFTASGTWTKPVTGTFKSVLVFIVGAGGGGGSGRCDATATARGGGGGGAGGGMSSAVYLASDLGATETVTVGAGGTGGAGVSTVATNGNTGGSPGQSAFGTTTRLRATAGTGGTGGQSGVGGVGGNGASGAAFAGSNGGTGSTGVAAATNGSASPTGSGPTGGGGGGGLTSANALLAAGLGGAHNATGNAAATGAAGFSNATNTPYSGGGGGGGIASIAGAGQAGGNGGSYGAGGGGGGATVTGQLSGAGGNGASGIVVVISIP